MGTPRYLDAALAEELHAAGLRVTMPRQVVLAWLVRHPHSTVEEIGAGVRESYGALSLQAIYGVLAACTDAGLLRRIELAGHPARFERRVGDNHHHLVCRGCGRTEDVDCVVGRRPCLEPADQCSYLIDEVEVIFWGLCPACAAAG
jgi:Fur family ferric uptake transcriptional regulator